MDTNTAIIHHQDTNAASPRRKRAHCSNTPSDFWARMHLQTKNGHNAQARLCGSVEDFMIEITFARYQHGPPRERVVGLLSREILRDWPERDFLLRDLMPSRIDYTSMRSVAAFAECGQIGDNLQLASNLRRAELSFDFQTSEDAVAARWPVGAEMLWNEGNYIIISTPNAAGEVKIVRAPTIALPVESPILVPQLLLQSAPPRL